ncbi:MAG: hypothetical protein IJ527_01685 [Prevotella sp.]|nr:hypothetical protein [Prevotella sp.]
MNEEMRQETWAEHVMLVDADYVDRVAFDLTVNFERMLQRRVPQADLARWIDCVALDGGLRPTTHEAHEPHKSQESQVIMLHSKPRLQNFVPGHFADELDGKAFNDNLGEFCISCVQVEKMTTMEDLFMESMQHLLQQQQVKNLMLVSDDSYLDQVLMHLQRTQQAREKAINVFTMQPVINGPYNQPILGFSLMAALGISGEEITNKQS